MTSKSARTCAAPTLIPRLLVGLVFLSEQLQKFITSEAAGAGRFAKSGFAQALFRIGFTGTFEIVGGVLVLLGLFTRLATLPLLIMMPVALITTKYATLIEKGGWATAHDYRTDFAMTMLPLRCCFGEGNYSLDKKWLKHER